MRSFKLLLVIAVAALMVCGVVPAASAAPLDTGTIDGITYSADPANVSAGATVVSYIAATGPIVVIPSTVTLGLVSYSVTTIGSFAFQNKALTSVVIPNSVTTISTIAFGNNKLTSVTIPDSVTTIGDGAFDDNLLTSVAIPNSVTTIGGDAFKFNELTSVIIPNSVTTIGDYTFYGNPLTSVQFLGAAPIMGSTSLGRPAGLLVTFFARYGALTVPGGFTTPT